MSFWDFSKLTCVFRFSEMFMPEVFPWRNVAFPHCWCICVFVQYVKLCAEVVSLTEGYRGNKQTIQYLRTLSLRLIGHGLVRMLAMISFWYWMFWNISSGSLLSTRSSSLSSLSEELQNRICGHNKKHKTKRISYTGAVRK